MWAGKPVMGWQARYAKTCVYYGGGRPLKPMPLLSPLAVDMWVGKPGDGLASPICEDMPLLRMMPPAQATAPAQPPGRGHVGWQAR